MAIWIAPDSTEGKLRDQWERPRNTTKDGLPGMNRVGYEEFPKCLYKAGRPTHANVEVTGSKTVHSEQEQSVALGQGWSLTQEDAIEMVHGEHVRMAKLAANRAFHEQTMSPAAQAEAKAFEADTVQHVAEIPAKPIRRKPGPKPKVRTTGTA